MINHLSRFLKTDFRYKWLMINLVIGPFFIIAPYIWMVSSEQQILTLKGMLCWYGLNQAFFGIGGFVTEERMDGTFSNLFLFPINFKQYFIAKGAQAMIETYCISILQICFFALCGIVIPDWPRFLVVLFVNDLVAVNMGILFLCLCMQFKRISSLNSLIQQVIGFLSGYSVDIKKYPKLIQFVSYIIPLTYTIAFARSDAFSGNLVVLVCATIASFLLAWIGFRYIDRDIQILRKSGEVDQW